MNTRLAVIAGTLLVGVSLFVTSMISNNLNNSSLTRSSEAQTVSCEADTEGVVAKLKNPRNRCTRPDGGQGFWYCDGRTPFGELKCPNGTSVPKEPYESCRCRSTDEWKTYFKAICCGGIVPTNTPTTAPGQPTNTPIPTAVGPTNTSVPGRPTNTPSPTPICVEDNKYGCTDTMKCCGVAQKTQCIKIDGNGFCLPPVPTSTTCINEAESGCPSTRCCNPSNTCVANYCVKPQPTQTPVPTEVPSCYNKICSNDADCGSGMKCIDIKNPSQTCTGLNCGRCVVEKSCPAIIGNESPEELKFKIECFCGQGGVKSCYNVCLNDDECKPSAILKCVPPVDGDNATCEQRLARGYGQCLCSAPYCPRYSAFISKENKTRIQNDNYLEALVKRGLNPFPGLRDLILQ